MLIERSGDSPPHPPGPTLDSGERLPNPSSVGSPCDAKEKPESENVGKLQAVALVKSAGSGGHLEPSPAHATWRRTEKRPRGRLCAGSRALASGDGRSTSARLRWTMSLLDSTV